MERRRHRRAGGLSRRDFLKAAAASTALAARAAANDAGAAAGGARVRVAVVGGESGASCFWHLHPDSVVTAVCDVRPEALDRLARAYACPTRYDDFDRLLADRNVDAVAMFVPLRRRADMACRAMEAGKHVLSAAPVADTLDDCRRLIDARRRTGRTFMPADPAVFRFEARTAAREFGDGRLGLIVHAEFEIHHENPDPLPFSRGWEPPLPWCPAVLPAGAGVRFASVSAMGWGDGERPFRDGRYRNAAWNTVALYRTAGGVLWRVSEFWHLGTAGWDRGVMQGATLRLEWPVEGGRGARVLGGEARQDLPHDDGFESLPAPLRVPSADGGTHAHITHEFIRAIIEKRRPIVDVREAVHRAASAILARQSAQKNGEAMPIPDFEGTA